MNWGPRTTVDFRVASVVICVFLTIFNPEDFHALFGAFDHLVYKGLIGSYLMLSWMLGGSVPTPPKIGA